MKMQRLLGDNEKLAWMLDQAAAMNFVVIGRIEGEINHQAVRDSLDALIQMHPLLATRLEQREDGPWVVTDDNVKPSLKILERENDEHWQVEAEKEVNIPFDRHKSPLWRVILLHSPTVNECLFTFYHPISDGLSGMYALRDFLTLLGTWKPGVSLAIPYAYPVRPAVEELLPPAAHGWSKFSKTIALVSKQAVNILFDRPRKLSVLETPRKERYTKLIHVTLPKETVDQLVAKCREHNTTMQGGLSASALLAISRQIEPGTPITVNCGSVVNLRKQLCPPLGDELGLLASGVITAHKLRPTPEFWSLAQEVKRDMDHAINTGEIYVTMTLAGKLVPKNASPDAFADKMTDIFPYASIVTNVGRVAIPEQYGSMKLTQIYAGASLKSLAGKEFNLTATTFAGQMNLGFFYTTPNLADGIANQIATDMIAILKENS